MPDISSGVEVFRRRYTPQRRFRWMPNEAGGYDVLPAGVDAPLAQQIMREAAAEGVGGPEADDSNLPRMQGGTRFRRISPGLLQHLYGKTQRGIRRREKEDLRSARLDDWRTRQRFLTDEGMRGARGRAELAMEFDPRARERKRQQAILEANPGLLGDLSPLQRAQIQMDPGNIGSVQRQRLADRIRQEGRADRIDERDYQRGRQQRQDALAGDQMLLSALPAGSAAAATVVGDAYRRRTGKNLSPAVNEALRQGGADQVAQRKRSSVATQDLVNVEFPDLLEEVNALFDDDANFLGFMGSDPGRQTIQQVSTRALDVKRRLEEAYGKATGGAMFRRAIRKLWATHYGEGDYQDYGAQAGQEFLRRVGF